MWIILPLPICRLLFWLVAAAALPPLHAEEPCCVWAQSTIDDVRRTAFPELANTEVFVRPLNSRSDFLRAAFSYKRYVVGVRMRYAISVNPRLLTLGAPQDGIRAIIAHELSHIAYYKKGSRLHLLGMVRMLAPGWRAGFERGADREAIRRGFGPGLKEYRKWLYRNIPCEKLPEKMRDYLSPEEIDAVMGSTSGSTHRKLPL